MTIHSVLAGGSFFLRCGMDALRFSFREQTKHNRQTQTMKSRSVFFAAAALFGFFVSIAAAQTFNTLYNFTGVNFTGPDYGAGPSTLILSGSTLYGRTLGANIFGNNAGIGGNSVIFSINTSGSNFRILSNTNAFQGNDYGNGLVNRLVTTVLLPEDY
jgi:hypothetical protein